VNEALAASAVCVAIGLLFGADHPRGKARLPFFAAPVRAHLARAAAAALTLTAFLLWNSAEPGPAAYLAIPVALMSFGTLITLLGPLGPRATWTIISLALPLGALLGWLGQRHG